MKTFVEGIKTPIEGVCQEANGLLYMPWPTAMALADRPDVRVVQFQDGNPFIEFFDSMAVAVDCSGGQRVWLPVMDARHNAVPASRASARDIGDAISRCRAKAVAMCHGVGMSLYAGYGDDIKGFLKALGVRPDSDLAEVPPLVSVRPGGTGAAYVDWAAAYTAAKLTDEHFRFEVSMFEDIDPQTGQIRVIPAKRVQGGWMVAVTLIYKGLSHTEWLPIMGIQEVETKKGRRKMDHQPLPNPDSMDWNRSVMRCMTRGIAILTGYGLSVYAGEEIGSLQREPIGRSSPAASSAPAAPETVAPDGSTEEPVEVETVEEPSNEVVDATLRRIAGIRSQASIMLAREQLTGKFQGTRALEVFLGAILRKEEELKQEDV